MTAVQVGHGIKIGRDVTVMDETMIGGYTKIGDRVKIGRRCSISDGISLSDGMVISGLHNRNPRAKRAVRGSFFLDSSLRKNFVRAMMTGEFL